MKSLKPHLDGVEQASSGQIGEWQASWPRRVFCEETQARWAARPTTTSSWPGMAIFWAKWEGIDCRRSGSPDAPSLHAPPPSPWLWPTVPAMLQALSNLDDRTSKLKNLYLNMAVGEANRQYKLLIAATVGPTVHHKGSRRKEGSW